MSDRRLMKNIVANLASSLQDLTTNFRKNQNLYLKSKKIRIFFIYPIGPVLFIFFISEIQSRKERSNMLFDTSQYSSSSALMTEENELDDHQPNQRQSSNYNYEQEQLKISRVNERLLNEREAEINHIVKSIHDLNELFKDLATMVVDQGTVLDRIDCNIERVSCSVEKGLGELQKAAKHQKASRKMYIIAVLMIIFIVLFFILILTKF
jgi:syntaxin 16